MIPSNPPTITIDAASLARITGFACNRTWAYICFFSITLFHIPGTGHVPPAFDIYLWSAGVLACTLALCACGRRVVEPVLAHPAGLFLGPMLMAAGSALIPAVGASTFGEAIHLALMIAASLLTGIGSALLLLSWGISFAQLSLRQLVSESCAAYFLGVVLFALLSITLPVAQFAFAIGLPFLSGWLCRNADGAAPEKREKAPRPPIPSNRRHQLAKIAVGVMLFGFIAGITRDLQPEASQAGAQEGYAPTMLVAMSLVIIVFAVIMGKRKSLDVNMLFRPALIIMLAGILLMPLFGAGSLAPAALVKTGYTCFELVVWIILGYSCQKFSLSPVLTFGFGRCLVAGSGFLGSAVAVALAPYLAGNPTMMAALSAALAFALVALCNFVLTTENFSKLWDEDEPPTRRTFQERCDEVFDHYELSPRQREIAYLIACGHDANYIGEKLFISQGTINAHRMRIYKKLDIHSRQELLNLVAAQEAAPATTSKERES